MDDLRGNVDTRLRKVSEGVVDAAVLALAGLTRLGIDPPACGAVSGLDVMVPAPGQGALALQAREDDFATLAGARRRSTTRRAGPALEAERSLMWRLGRRLRASARRARDRRRRRASSCVAVVVPPDGLTGRSGGGRFGLTRRAAGLATKELIAEGAEEILEALDGER